MKIINLLTNIIFDLPQNEAIKLLTNSPDVFAELDKDKNIIKNTNFICQDNSVLSKILEK